MGKRKIPDDAFEYYFGLGYERSYQAVAEHYGVSKTAVFNVAKREAWADRIEERERKARIALDKKAVETLEQMNERHVKISKFIQRRALEALQAMPLDDAMSAVRALDLGVKQERLIRGEPTDRSAISTEEIIKREYERWMGKAEAEDEPEDTPDDGPGGAAG